MTNSENGNGARSERPFPRRTLENALRVPQAIKLNNGGNAWSPEQVAKALALGPKSGNFFYIAGASRDYGLTEGSRDSAAIELTDLGRSAMYPRSPDEERSALRDAFLRVDLFKRVLLHFGGSNLPERKFLDNTLRETFGLDPAVHDEFIDIFTRNCRFVGIGSDFEEGRAEPSKLVGQGTASVTVSSPNSTSDAPVCFVIMPFVEHDDRYPPGFFDEALKQVLSPAITGAGFTVRTARRPGSDVIQSTIVNDLLAADLVVADLTEHNPNVLFELGMRMAKDKPVCLVRAKGTGPIFDVDNVLRVEDYNPNLWPSTVERDIPRLQEHVRATWDSRDSGMSYLRILQSQSAS